MYSFSFMLICFLSVHDSFDFRAQAVVDMLSTVVRHYYALSYDTTDCKSALHDQFYLDDIVLLADVCHVAVGRKMKNGHSSLLSGRPSTSASIVHIFTLAAHSNPKDHASAMK